MPRFFAPAPREVRILLIIDRSGSMWKHQSQIQYAVSNFLRLLAKDEGYRVSLLEFSGALEIKVQAVGERPAEIAFYYQPSGGTALWDAIARGLEVESSTSPTLCLILTDGIEESSLKYSHQEIFARIQGKLAQGNWSFLCLNMSGEENPSARALQIECLDFSKEDAPEMLATLAGRIAGAVSRMRVAGERKVEIAGLLER